ncbi:MAG: wax ester/triacylglycerol synthase family O-acyltransferase [Actinomycetota bacterium]|nr:wax ester/triacylglycerol synthase family O-acyltransferase [Actinomycetota bacterium]
MRRLSDIDSAVLASDGPHSQNLLVPVGIYDPSTAPGGTVSSGGTVSFDDVVAFVQSRLGVSRSFRERIVTTPFGLDRPRWEREPDFDIGYHVRQIALPAPGDWHQFCTQVARLGERPLDLTRPPWELYVVHGLNAVDGVPPGSFAVVLKLHHAAVDGATGAEIFTALHDTSRTAAPQGVPRHEPDNGGGGPSLVGMLAQAGWRCATLPFTVAGSLAPALIRALPALLRPQGDTTPGRRTDVTVATRFNHPIGAHRSFGAVSLPLAELNRLRAGAPGATVNDVALTIVSGALRAYLDELGELPEVSLLALTPISMKPSPGKRSGTQVGDGDEGRQYRMTTLVLATHREHPLARLQIVQHCTQAAKQHGAIDAPALLNVAEVLPGALMGTVQRAVARTVNRAGRTLGCHTVITNVPGPQMPVYFCGARAVLLSGMSPVADGLGLTHAVSSYAGTITVSFTADRDMLPDPAAYERCIRQSIADLSAALPPPAAPPEPRKPVQPRKAVQPRKVVEPRKVVQPRKVVEPRKAAQPGKVVQP